MENLKSVHSTDTSSSVLVELPATKLSQHPWLVLDKRQKHKRLYVFRLNGELLVFRDGSFDKLDWQYDPFAETLILQKTNFDSDNYQLTECRPDLLIWYSAKKAEELILIKSDYQILNKFAVPTELVDLSGLQQPIQNTPVSSSNTNFKKPDSMKKSSYDLYVERKMKMVHLALGKKILTYLSIGLAAITLLMFAFTEIVEQPQALLNGIPYCLAGMATCFLGIQVINSKLRELKKKKKSKVKTALEPAASF